MLGWEVHRTFYVPDVTLAVIGVATLVLLAIGWLTARQRQTLTS